MLKNAGGACLVAALLLFAREAGACQDPPDIPCGLVPAASVIPPGVPFDVVFSMTNLFVDRRTGFPGPPADDLDYTITVDVEQGWDDPGGNECFGTGIDVPSTIDPTAPLTVQLDDAWSPAADEPTSFLQVFRITPSVEWPAYAVTVSAISLDGSRSCTQTVCIRVEEPTDPPQPWAEFVDPVQAGDGGALLPFDLMVHRDGYEPTNPLRVVVRPVNPSDPVDIFPLDPPELADSSRGVIVTQEDELVHFTCHCHFPCFVGASNLYEVYLVDTVTGGWVWYSRYIGKAFVDRAPLARIELVEINDAGGDGALQACEAAQVHVRLIGRHPFANVPMLGMRMDLPLPQGVTVASWSLHFHDNPMDSVDPLPTELEATGTVTPGPSHFIVDSDRVAYRYETIPSRPPVFKDMVEAELLLDIAPGALGSTGTLDFAGYVVSGVVSGITRSETAPTLSLPIAPGGPAPAEISSPGQEPLLLQADEQTLTWDGSGASSFNVYRGDIASLPDYGACLRAGLTSPTLTDADPLPQGGAWFYLVSGVSCGAEGPLGTDSLDGPRVPQAWCN